jgi:hypothetical protein
MFHTTRAISAASRHLEEEKVSHYIVKPGKPLKAKLEGDIMGLLIGSKPVSQAVANHLSGFDVQVFQLAAVTWLSKNNHPLSELKSPTF